MHFLCVYKDAGSNHLPYYLNVQTELNKAVEPIIFEQYAFSYPFEKSLRTSLFSPVKWVKYRVKYVAEQDHNPVFWFGSFVCYIYASIIHRIPLKPKRDFFHL